MAINTTTVSITSAYSSITDLVTVTDGTDYADPIPTLRTNYYLTEFSAYKASGGDEAITLTPDSTDPQVVASWTYTPATSGWYRNKIVIAFLEAIILSNNTNFTYGDVVYNGGSYYIYNSLVDSTDTIALDATKWDALTSTNAINANYVVDVDIFVTQDTQECLEAEQIRLGREFQNNCGCDVDCSTETKLRTWLTGSTLLFAIPDRAGAQKMIEKTIEICNCL
jgi:hypothetical protein